MAAIFRFLSVAVQKKREFIFGRKEIYLIWIIFVFIFLFVLQIEMWALCIQLCSSFLWYLLDSTLRSRRKKREHREHPTTFAYK